MTTSTGQDRWIGFRVFYLCGLRKQENRGKIRRPKPVWRGGSRAVLLGVMNEATEILNAIAGGDPTAANRLLPLVYEELRKLAAQRLGRENPGQTLQATALVHEAYVRLVGNAAEEAHWNGRGHFFAAAAEAMRRILIERARRKRTARHGGGRRRISLDQIDLADEVPDDDLIALDEALEELNRDDPEAAAVVKLRYFAGLTAEQAAEALEISLRTANRHWAYARAQLFRRLHGSDETES
jgi:RNA polymerase sigma factor (TIGR02999 family)